MLLFKNLINSFGFVEIVFVSLGCMCNEARIKSNFMYQISIALNGKFLFRTDWIGNRTDATITLLELKNKFNEDCYSITLCAKSPMQLDITVGNVGEAMEKAIKFIYPNS